MVGTLGVCLPPFSGLGEHFASVLKLEEKKPTTLGLQAFFSGDV